MSFNSALLAFLPTSGLLRGTVWFWGCGVHFGSILWSWGFAAGSISGSQGFGFRVRVEGMVIQSIPNPS